MGVVGIRIHGLTDRVGLTSTMGRNPFDHITHGASKKKAVLHRRVLQPFGAYQPRTVRLDLETPVECCGRSDQDSEQELAKSVDGKRIVANGKLLRQLIRSGAEGDAEAFRDAAEQVIDDERQKHHHLLASDLETILHGCSSAHQSSALRGLAGAVPQDRERGIPLVTVREPSTCLQDVVLSRDNLSLVSGILNEHHRQEVLEAHGLRASDRILLYGPPGCGKTLIAEAIAGELGRPLAVVRMDSVVSSFLGETAANLRKVFDFVASSALVALFDEFDALGKEREDATEHGELRRVVNAVLQMLDAYRGRSLIIAATNHEGMLDAAIWRRFEEVLLLKPPTPAQLCRLIEVKLRGVSREFDIRSLVERGWFKGDTHADVERVLRRAVKDMVLEGDASLLHLRHIDAARSRENARRRRVKV